ncbi:MAG: hypothetical protein PHT95_07675 [Candidatus Omnitrophica bacterium]|nr:hypothetical protein [Candidatus Omnitrophota bacterium]
MTLSLQNLAAGLGISGAGALALGDCLAANLLFSLCNPILVCQFWSHGGRAQVIQFCIYEVLALAGIVRQLGVEL